MLLWIFPLSWLVLGAFASPRPLVGESKDVQCVLGKYNQPQVSRAASKYCSSVLEKTTTATTRVTPLVTLLRTTSVTDTTKTDTSTESTTTETTAFSTILTTTATSGTHAKRTAAAIPPPRAVSTYPQSILSSACDRFIQVPTATTTATETVKAKTIKTTTTTHVTAQAVTTTTITSISTTSSETLAASPACDPGSDSALNNYGFETSGLYPWNGGGGGRSSVVSSPLNPNNGGSHVLQVTVTPNPESASLFTMSQEMNLCPLTTYTASLDINFLTELDNGGVLFYLIFPDGTQQWLEYLIPANDDLPTLEWLHYEWTYTTTEEQRGATLAMQALSWQQTTDFVFALDNVKMVPAGSGNPAP